MEIINTKPGYKINCTPPEYSGCNPLTWVSVVTTIGIILQFKQIHFALGQILFEILTNIFCNFNCTPAEYSVCNPLPGVSRNYDLNYFFNLNKYILATMKNIFCNFEKYILQL